MRRKRNDSLQRYIVVAIGLLVLVLVGIGVVLSMLLRDGGTSGSATISEPDAVVEIVDPTAAPPPPTAEPPTLVPPTADNAIDAVPPTAPPTLRPTPSPTLPPLWRIGWAQRDLECGFWSEAVSLVLQDEFGMMVELVELDSADTLFTALSEREVDMTFCFVDPDDRSQISGENGDRVGYIRQFGSHYWASDAGKLQAWGNGAAKATMRDELPCVLTMLENITVPDGVEAANDAAAWVNDNNDIVRSWITCTP